jgi:hypothetical protein
MDYGIDMGLEYCIILLIGKCFAVPRFALSVMGLKFIQLSELL